VPEYDVEVRDLSKVYGNGVKAVNHVSFGIERGSFFTLLGPSGSGKTTILRMIGGLERPTGGRVFIGGRDVTHLPPYDRDTSMVFQSLALFPHLSVSGNIAFGLRMRKVPEKQVARRVYDALELVELPPKRYGNRRITQLSGGERQRVALARALVTEPRVLLLDEPFGALDLKLRKQMQVETKKLQERLGITFVFVTHDQEEALTMSNVIGVINLGRVEQLGNSQQIYERPATRFVASFIGDANILSGTVGTVNDGHASVTQVSRQLVAAAEGVQPGQEVYVSVRPEKVRVGPAAEACANRFEGTVVDQVYVGQASKVTVQLEDGERLVSTVQISDIGQTVPVGSRLTIGWNPENAVIIPKPSQDEEQAVRKLAKAERSARKREATAAKRFGLAVRLAVFLGVPFLAAGIVVGVTMPDPLTSLLGYGIGIGVFAASLAFLAVRLVQSRRTRTPAASG
jgi:spermidine/putrescine transport system ATP-binding protein